ncbi:hypothetical protein [Bdellovibrio sp. HCB337]|uniref:hypothetical protein n=1 Tax=Bdellovibrio sp. HCB337 TaxID=3394358 RepID=UPI0039A737D0
MKIRNAFSALCALSLIYTVGCANNSGSTSPASSDNGKLDQAYPLLWEDAHNEGKDWTSHVYDIINKETPDLVQGAEDITAFCPRYFQLTTDERINFWGVLISGIVKYESNFDPTNRMHETTMGTDPVTGRPVYSEGLMQLSYQDIRPYPFCEFDWDTDRKLKPNDPNKTILDPYKNLSCGVKILAQQIKNRNRITLTKGVYWSVIKVNGKYSKIPQIAALTRQMPGCMN